MSGGLPSVKKLCMLPGFAPDIARRWRAMGWSTHRGVDRMLEAANGIMGGSGVEAIRGDNRGGYYQDIAALYINMGDTYDMTLLYDVERDEFYVTSWGDWLETAERSD